jgi:hypothetical protein
MEKSHFRWTTFRGAGHYVFRGETGTVFVINVCHSISAPSLRLATIPKECKNSRSISMATRSKILPAVLHSTNVTSKENSATSYGASGVQRLSTRMHPARSSHREQPARPSPRHPVFASGPVKLAIHFGLSPTSFTRLATRFRTARPWICPDGIQVARKTSLPDKQCTRLCLSCPMVSCSPAQAISAGSGCGLYQRSPPTPGDGVRSTA